MKAGTIICAMILWISVEVSLGNSANHIRKISKRQTQVDLLFNHQAGGGLLENIAGSVRQILNNAGERLVQTLANPNGFQINAQLRVDPNQNYQAPTGYEQFSNNPQQNFQEPPPRRPHHGHRHHGHRPPHRGQGPPPYGQGPPPNGQGPPPYGQGPPPYGQGPPPYGQGPPTYGQGPPPPPPYGQGQPQSPPYGQGPPPPPSGGFQPTPAQGGQVPSGSGQFPNNQNFGGSGFSSPSSSGGQTFPQTANGQTAPSEVSVSGPENNYYDNEDGNNGSDQKGDDASQIEYVDGAPVVKLAENDIRR